MIFLLDAWFVNDDVPGRREVHAAMDTARFTRKHRLKGRYQQRRSTKRRRWGVQKSQRLSKVANFVNHVAMGSTLPLLLPLS